jgi:hypothetical protein
VRAIALRATAAKKMAFDALDIDGTEAAARGLDQVLGCRATKQECNNLALSMRDSNARVGALAGRAVRAANEVLELTAERSGPRESSRLAAKAASFEPSVLEAERSARQAYDQAQKNAADKAEHQRKMDAEVQAISAATAACGSNEAACSSRCDKGEAPMCLAFADRLRGATPPKIAEAQRVAAKACGMQLQHACDEVSRIDEEIDRQDQADRAWTHVRGIGDELTRAQFQQELGIRNAMSQSGAMALQQMALYVNVLVTEQYCPAKSEFLARASEAEFEQRAADHCAGDPPTNDGVTGAVVPLAEQCKAAFAVACAFP